MPHVKCSKCGKTLTFPMMAEPQVVSCTGCGYRFRVTSSPPTTFELLLNDTLAAEPPPVAADQATHATRAANGPPPLSGDLGNPSHRSRILRWIIFGAGGLAVVVLVLLLILFLVDSGSSRNSQDPGDHENQVSDSPDQPKQKGAPQASNSEQIDNQNLPDKPASPPAESVITSQPEDELSKINNPASPPAESATTPQPEDKLSKINNPASPPAESATTPQPEDELSKINKPASPLSESATTSQPEDKSSKADWESYPLQKHSGLGLNRMRGKSGQGDPEPVRLRLQERVVIPNASDLFYINLLHKNEFIRLKRPVGKTKHKFPIINKAALPGSPPIGWITFEINSANQIAATLDLEKSKPEDKDNKELVTHLQWELLDTANRTFYMLYFPPELKSIERTIGFDSDPTSPTSTITDLHDVAKITTFDGIELSKKEDGTFIYEEEKGLFEIQFIKLKDSEFRIRLSSDKFKKLRSRLFQFINLVKNRKQVIDVIEDDLEENSKKQYRSKRRVKTRRDLISYSKGYNKWSNKRENAKENLETRLKAKKDELTQGRTLTEKTTQQLNDLIKKISTDIKAMKFFHLYGDLIMELTLQFKPPELPSLPQEAEERRRRMSY